MKESIKKILGPKVTNTLRKVRDRIQIRGVYRSDLKKFIQHSLVFKNETPQQLEAKITLLYHSLEKGFLHDPIRPYFAKAKVIELLSLLQDSRTQQLIGSSQIQSAAYVLCSYYDWHTNHNHPLSYFPREIYNRLQSHHPKGPSPIKHIPCSNFQRLSAESFEEFAKSRVSIREFSEQEVSDEVFKDVVRVANTAPTACNRQGIFIHLLRNKRVIDQILAIQGGLHGFEKTINRLIVLTADRNYYYLVGERNYFYVDGGIFLMNLLYSLQSHGIAACAAHWGLLPGADKTAGQILGLRSSEQIIAVIAVGYPKEDNIATASHRRSPKENLIFH